MSEFEYEVLVTLEAQAYIFKNKAVEEELQMCVFTFPKLRVCKGLQSSSRNLETRELDGPSAVLAGLDCKGRK